MVPHNVPQYPYPFIIPPKGDRHAQTFVVLHGRGSNGEHFGAELLRTSIPEFGSLRNAFPDAKFIFPTAAKRRAQIYKRTPINQWFDNWSLQTPTEREELQFDGLRESSAFIHGILDSEIELVRASNVILWGLNQGCATSLIALLLWQGPNIAATIGMCGWLPLRKRLLDSVVEEEANDPNDPFSSGMESGGDANDHIIQSNLSKAAVYLRDELDLAPLVNAPAAPRTPVFLGHGTEDDKVPIQLGREAADLLRLLQIDVRYHEYEGLGHWYSGPMLRDILLFIQSNTQWSVIRENIGA